jgi:hypothetical protein
MSGYRDIEGVVKRVDARGILFRIGCEIEDVEIPHAALEHPESIAFGDNWISVSRTFLKKLERPEGA